MKTIDRAPITGDDDWRFWEKSFTYPVAPYPTEHLIGRIALEDKVMAAEDNFERGSELSPHDTEMLKLAYEFIDPPVDY